MSRLSQQSDQEEDSADQLGRIRYKPPVREPTIVPEKAEDLTKTPFANTQMKLKQDTENGAKTKVNDINANSSDKRFKTLDSKLQENGDAQVELEKSCRTSQESDAEVDTADFLRPHRLHPPGHDREVLDGRDVHGNITRESSPSPRRQQDFVDSQSEKPEVNVEPEVVNPAAGDQIPLSEEDITDFLEACSNGEYDRLKHTIIPRIKNLNKDIRQLTNDAYYSATGLHSALLSNQKETANLLIEEFGKELVLQHYTHSENYGLTALHIAITQNMVDSINNMLEHLSESEKNDLVHTECKGSFFNEEWNISSNPLTLALLCKHCEIVEILLRSGADHMHKSECNGETILHSLARHSLNAPEDAKVQLKMLTDALANIRKQKYGYCKEMDGLLKVTNDDGLTPMVFSLKIGAAAMVQALLEIPWVYKMPQWNYNPLQLDIYDVTELRTKQLPWNISGLEILASSTSKKMLQLYKKEPIRTLVADAWRQYSVLHMLDGIGHIALMIVFSIGVMSKHLLLRNVKPASQEEGWVVAICVILSLKSFWGIVTTVADIVLYILPLCSRKKYNLMSLDQEQSSNGADDMDKGIQLGVYTRKTENGESVHYHTVDKPLQSTGIKERLNVCKMLLRINTFKVIYFILNVMVLAWSVLRLAGNEYEATVAVCPLILGWYACIYYSMFSKKIFLFMLMLNNMLLSNVVYFMIALALIMTGFGIAFLNLQDPTKSDMHDMFPFWRLINTLFRQMLALNDIDELMDCLKFPVCARLVMLAFFIVATVLLLNTLLASMTDTYTAVRDNKIALWFRIKLQMALQIDRPSFGLCQPLIRKPKKVKKANEKFYLEVHTITTK